MKKLLSFIVLAFMLVFGSTSYADTTTSAPINIDGNAFYNATFTPAGGTCVLSNQIHIDGLNHVMIYSKVDNNAFAEAGGYMIVEFSPNGVVWYDLQGTGWSFASGWLVPFPPANGVYNYTFSYPTGSVVATDIRFKVCFAVVNLTVSVFGR
jgi:hypothetical protein